MFYNVLLSRRRAAFAALFILAVFLAGLLGNSFAATIFQDGFESASLGAAWTASSTNQGRATVTTDFEPATGSYHLVLDDAVNDSTYSVAEVTLHLDLSAKKNVVLSFKTKSLGNEPNDPPQGTFYSEREYDGIAISTDGGMSWYAVSSLAYVGTAWQTITVPLDYWFYGSYGADFRIRFSEYDNSPAPLDGLAFDDVLVTADNDYQSSVELPSPILEGTGGQTGYVFLNFTPASDLTLDLVASPAGEVIMPQTITIPAGAQSGSFPFSVPDDTIVNLTRNVTVSANGGGITSHAGKLTIYDDDAPIPSLSIPAQLSEGVYINAPNAILSIDRPASQPLTMSFMTNGSLALPYSVTIPAGQTQVSFTIYAVEDSAITGNIPVTVTATAPGIQTASAQTTLIDNDPRILSLVLPASIQEDQSAFGTVKIPGYLPNDLVLQLSSSDPAQASVPASVVIPAGATSNTFLIQPHDNNVRDGSRNVTISAQADTFTSASAVATIRDNEVAGYRATVATDIVNASAPVSYTISAVDVEGNVILGVVTTVNVTIVNPDGTTQPASPSTVQLNGTTTSASTTIAAPSTSPLRIRVTDSNGNSGDSQLFDFMRLANLTATDLVWDSFRNRFYASIPSTATNNANQVVAIDPATMQVTASVVVGQNPGQLALTGGGEALYVVLTSNQTIDRIDPQTMTVVSSFSIGNTINDICAVPADPNQLIVASYSSASSSNVVSRYNNGLIVGGSIMGNAVEPSADPAIFFIGLSSYSSSSGLGRYKLDANGFTALGSSTSIYVSPTMRSSGDLIVYNTVEIDGTHLRAVGNFTGVSSYYSPIGWRPDAPANRVYFLGSSAGYSSQADRILSYDPATLSLIRSSSMPTVTFSGYSPPNTLIRWGNNGLAFCASNSIVAITAGQLVPSAPSADLSVTAQATPTSVSVGDSITYTLQVTNNGPNLAQAVFLTCSLSDGQTFQSSSSSGGTVTINSGGVTASIGNLAVGATASLIITTKTQPVGSVSCTASVSSTSVDPTYTNNVAYKLVPVGFQNTTDVLNNIRLGLNNLIFDSSRNLLWGTVGSSGPATLSNSVVSIDPTTGQVLATFPLGWTPLSNLIALSPNNRYLYLAGSNVYEVQRIDLASNPLTSVHIPLIPGQSGYSTPEDLAVLDGDGTSFILTTVYDGAAIYDGSVKRGSSTGIYTADKVERTATPNVFVSIETYSSSFQLSKLTVSPTGVSATKTTSPSPIGGSDIRSSDNLVLSTAGRIADINTLTLKLDLGVTGVPCLDAPNGRAYIAGTGQLRAFETVLGLPIATITLPGVPTSGYPEWVQACVRWGADGMAVAGLDKTFFIRWSATSGPGSDQNADHVSDQWEMAYFGTTNVDLTADPDHDGIPNVFEYFFGTSPFQVDSNPVQVGIEDAAAGSEIIHLIYPRRADISPSYFSYEVSADLKQWATASGVTETVKSTRTVDGVQIQTIDAAIPAPIGTKAFARLRWIGP